jgi:hypothetical protein
MNEQYLQSHGQDVFGCTLLRIQFNFQPRLVVFTLCVLNSTLILQGAYRYLPISDDIVSRVRLSWDLSARQQSPQPESRSVSGQIVDHSPADAALHGFTGNCPPSGSNSDCVASTSAQTVKTCGRSRPSSYAFLTRFSASSSLFVPSENSSSVLSACWMGKTAASVLPPAVGAFNASQHYLKDTHIREYIMTRDQ